MSQFHFLFLLICIFLSLVESMNVPPNPYPFYVRVGASLEEPSVEDLCGGVIVASNMVVTCASCLFLQITNNTYRPAKISEIFVYSGQSLVQKPSYSWVGKGFLNFLTLNYFTSHKVANYKVHDEVVSNDIAFVILQHQFYFKATSNAYLDLCGIIENGGYGSETAFILPRLEATEYVDEKRWIELGLSEVNRVGDGTSCYTGMDAKKLVCYETKNKIDVYNGDPLVYKSSSGEFQCLLGLKVTTKVFTGTQMNTYIRSDWAFEWINEQLSKID